MRAISATASDLAEFRRRIDAIDERVHDLIIERAAIVMQIAAEKRGTGAGYYQPAREAEILRRLAARHHGSLPVASVLRMWRELLGATVRIETPFAVAVLAPPQLPGLWDLARDHYGSCAPVSACNTSAEVIGAVVTGAAAVGVLPMPRPREADPWWRRLLSSGEGGPRIIARLPFAGHGNARSDGTDALVVGRAAAVATGADRTLFGVESTAEIGLDRLLRLIAGTGLKPTLAAASPHHERELNLVEVDGFVMASDARITALRAELGSGLARLAPLGGYALPLRVPTPSAAKTEA